MSPPSDGARPTVVRYGLRAAVTNEFGEYVSAADYDALRAEVESLRETREMQRMFITALSNELRGVGCSLDETPKVVNARAEAAEAKVAQSVERIDHEISVWAGRMSTLALTQKWPQAGDVHSALLHVRAALNEGDGE